MIKKTFLNARCFLLDDKKIVCKLILFTATDFVFKAEWDSTHDSIDGVERILGNEGLHDFKLQANVFIVEEGLDEMHKELLDVFFKGG